MEDISRIPAFGHKLLALDWHGVADRIRVNEIAQIFSSALSQGIAIFICSYILESSLAKRRREIGVSATARVASMRGQFVHAKCFIDTTRRERASTPSGAKRLTCFH